MVMRRKAAADAGNKVMARRVRRIEFWSRVSAEMQEFETFVMRGPAEFERLRTPQVDYLRADGKQADLIGRTEHLEADLNRLFAERGLSKPLVERRNAGPPTDYRTHYSVEMRDRVAELFAPDIERFGYEFCPLCLSARLEPLRPDGAGRDRAGCAT